MTFQTKSDYIYYELKRDILKKVFHEGERLVVSDLAKKYDVSPMPIREALLRLSQERHIELIPHIGAKVISINQEQFTEIQVVRGELEAVATRFLAPLITDEQLFKLNALIQEGKDYLDDDHPESYLEWNKRFHFLVAEMNPNRILEEYIKSDWNKLEYIVNGSLAEKWRVKDSFHEHELWFKALRLRDPVKAEMACRSHCTAVAQMNIGDLLR